MRGPPILLKRFTRISVPVLNTFFWRRISKVRLSCIASGRQKSTQAPSISTRRYCGKRTLTKAPHVLVPLNDCCRFSYFPFVSHSSAHGRVHLRQRNLVSAHRFV